MFKHYETGVDNLILKLQKQIRTTNFELKRMNRFILPQIINKSCESERYKKVLKTLEDPILKQYSNQRYLDNSENSIRHISYEVKKSNCIKPPVELVKLDECQVFVWRISNKKPQNSSRNSRYSNVQK
ncbi:unnamed protein product (macronuclear) [Paramecium tetraurelia]|uniref:Uncharacterized protein n=1 Tax=Paramecium tetraurelia TaxID=5888 RepID=A0CN23_PARTE|nr:uncharacterized protein GSPATT00008631001 [Paramecium tetraurelia]CAK72190.1 unnamed protein product [Paramecium tetraurelia]|eukprot:XP_001439587.1 hypothetical protein (macronuclear) [Paramecium tetraurelia strain d4-2]